jgi:hypothetical protein
MGHRAGFCNTTGSFNNFMGYRAGFCNTTGNFNNFMGRDAGRYNTCGNFNNFMGESAGLRNTTGNYNNFIGRCAGCTNTIGSNNIILGNLANVATNSLSGVIVLGAGALATRQNELVIGSNNPPLSGILFGNLAVTANTAALSTTKGTSDNWNSNYTTVSQLSNTWTDYGSEVAITSNSLVLELSAFSYFLVNLNNNITTITLRNPKTAPLITSFVLQLSGDGIIRSVVWPAYIRWPGNTAPIITSTLGSVDTFTFFSYDGGISYYGFPTGFNS